MERRILYSLLALLLLSAFVSNTKTEGVILTNLVNEYQFSEPISNKLLALPYETVNILPSLPVTDPSPSQLHSFYFWNTPHFTLSFKNRIISLYKGYIVDKGSNTYIFHLIEKRKVLYFFRSLLI